MKQNSLLQHTVLHLLLLVIASALITFSYGYTMLDDGWRHLAMAFQEDKMHSWGHLFINSLYKEYDPWFFWHTFLNKLEFFIPPASIPMFVNTLTYSFLSIWTYIILRRHSQLPLYFIFLFALLIPLYCYRYLSLRPDLLSGLFLLSTILISKNKWVLYLLTLLYAPMYYLFWFFIGYLGFVKLILKEYRTVVILFILTLLGFAFHLWYDYEGYLSIMKNVLNNDALTQGYSVSESSPKFLPMAFKNMIGSSLLLLILMGLSVWLFNIFKPKSTIYKYFILFIPLFITQARFYELLIPLIFVSIIIGSHHVLLLLQKNGIDATLKSLQQFLETKTYILQLFRKKWSYLFFTLFFLLFLSHYVTNREFYTKQSTLTNYSTFFSSPEFHNKRIFLSGMNGIMYRAIFFNPTGQYMPNCSLGWVDLPEELRKIYFKIYKNQEELSKEEFFKFIKYNNFDYIVLTVSSFDNIGFSEYEILENGYKFKKIIYGNVVFSRIP